MAMLYWSGMPSWGVTALIQQSISGSNGCSVCCAFRKRILSERPEIALRRFSKWPLFSPGPDSLSGSWRETAKARAEILRLVKKATSQREDPFLSRRRRKALTILEEVLGFVLRETRSRRHRPIDWSEVYRCLCSVDNCLRDWGWVTYDLQDRSWEEEWFESASICSLVSLAQRQSRLRDERDRATR